MDIKEKRKKRNMHGTHHDGGDDKHVISVRY